MPLYRAEIFKGVPTAGGPWCNTYFIRHTDLAAAFAFARDDLVPLDKVVHMDYVNYLRLRVKTITEDPPAPFTVQTLTGTGLRTSSSQTLPLWNVFRIDFNVFGGRPSRKFFRGPVLESDQNGGGIDSTILSLFNTDFCNYAEANLFASGTDPGLVDESNNNFSDCQVYPFVAMRQRTRKRRARAGAPAQLR